jgi:CheY-like chemotaxis protein
LVKTLIEMHGGSVSVRSDGLGKGSEFTLRLPVHISTEPLSLEAGEGEARRVDQHERPRPCRILVVDDNVDMARSMARLLNASGYELSIAHNGAEGLELAPTFRPDLVLLDIGLPDMNGCEVAQAFRKNEQLRNAVLIAVSGYGQEHHRVRAREAGFDYHLVKPVEFDALLSLLRSL